MPDDSADKVARQPEFAAENNALWCDAVCSAHGVPGEFFDGIWINRRRTPRFHPNAITFRKGRGAEAISQVESVLAVTKRGPCSVKDSFCEMSLEQLGFKVLFEAAWICLAPRDRVMSPRLGTDIAFESLRDVPSLEHWENAWWIRCSGQDRPGDAVRPVQFPPALAAQPWITVVAGHRGERIVAGGILNVGAGCVCVSNVFCDLPDERATWAALIHLAGQRYPGLPLVGYEHDERLQVPFSVGFHETGRLRVWLREAG